MGVLCGVFLVILQAKSNITTIYLTTNRMKRKLFAVFFLLTGIMCRAGSEVPVIITAGQSNADGRVPIAELPSYIHYDYCRWSYGSGDFLNYWYEKGHGARVYKYLYPCTYFSTPRYR